MSKTAEEKAKKLLNSEMGKGLDMAKLAAIMDSPTGKAMMNKLKGPEGDSLRQAASGAADGDTAAMAAMLSQLMSTREGKDLAGQVMDMKKESGR